jgi:hypothetical protein
MGLSRRVVLRLFAAGGVASVLAACTTAVPSSPTAAAGKPTTAAATPNSTSGTAAPTSAPAEQPRAGGILRQGNLGDLPTLDGNFLNG